MEAKWLFLKDVQCFFLFLMKNSIFKWLIFYQNILSQIRMNLNLFGLVPILELLIRRDKIDCKCFTHFSIIFYAVMGNSQYFTMNKA